MPTTNDLCMSLVQCWIYKLMSFWLQNFRTLFVFCHVDLFRSPLILVFLSKFSHFDIWQTTTTYILMFYVHNNSESMGKTFQAAQLTHERFATGVYSNKISFWHLTNWTSTNLWCVALYVTYSTTHQRLVEVQFGRYQKNILQEWCRVKKLSCVSYGSLKRFPHTFTTLRKP